MHRWIGAGFVTAASLVAGPQAFGAEGAETAPRVSLHPPARPDTHGSSAERPAQDFQSWLVDFARDAEAAGVSRRITDQALRGLRYDAEVIRRDRNQSEFTKAIWDYLDTAVSDLRVANGRKALAQQQALVTRIEQRFGVDAHIVVAIWGLESAYGSFRGSHNIIRSLASLAYDPRRSEFFRAELLTALQILEAGDVTPGRMTGSWAGAMGHTQFMPGSYRDHAVDFDEDGKRDIWSDDPTDALASTAAYLKAHGWVKGQPWGVEVRLPSGFDYTQADRDIRALPSGWAAQGIVSAQGKAVPDHGPASILLPAGAEGPAFMIFDNFEVLEQYNTADAYVIGVGHLGDRINGAGPIRAVWPRADGVLSYAERQEVQQRLTAAGFDTQKIDGKIGPLTIAAARAYQQSKGLVPDGYVSRRLLNHLR